MLTASHESTCPALREPFSPKSGDDAEKVGMRGLTFELSGRRRQCAGPGLWRMYLATDRARRTAVGAPLERGVRQRWWLP